MAVLGLCCCVWAFSGCSERGHSSYLCVGFSLRWFLLWSMGSRHVGFSSCGARVQLPHGKWNLPGPGIAPVSPAIGRWILNHWTTREAPFAPNFREENKRYSLFQEVYSFWSLLVRLFVLFLGHKPQNHFGQKVVFCQYLYGVSLEVNSALRLMTSLITPLLRTASKFCVLKR